MPITKIPAADNYDSTTSNITDTHTSSAKRGRLFLLQAKYARSTSSAHAKKAKFAAANSGACMNAVVWV